MKTFVARCPKGALFIICLVTALIGIFNIIFKPICVNNTSIRPPIMISNGTANASALSILPSQSDLSQIINPTLLPYKSFSPALTNDTFVSPTDSDFNVKLPGLPRTTAKYLRPVGDIEKRGKLGNCTQVLDVMDWVMKKVNAKNDGTLMIAYGSLIHLFREKDFVKNTTGGKITYFDDDIDTFVSLDTIVYIASLEPELFRRFGWTMRISRTQKENYIIFAQIMTTCGHRIVERTVKNVDSVAIELYLIVTSPHIGKELSRVVKDMWQGTRFHESLIFPVKRFSFKSIGLSHHLQLQVPNKYELIMECLYGDWRTPNSGHAGPDKVCRESHE